MANEVSNGLHNAVPYHWEYADAAARTGATGFVVDDLGKLAHQADDHSLWLLTATTPTWVPVGAGGVSTTQIAYALSAGRLTGNTHLIYNVAGGGATGGQLISELIGAGGAAVAGYGDTGYGGDFEASGAGGYGVYAYSTGAGGFGLVAESGAATVIPLQGTAPSGQTADLLQLLVNSVVKFAVAPSGRPRFVSTPPSSATDTGAAGEIAWDSTYLYVAVGTNTWKRTALSTW